MGKWKQATQGAREAAEQCLSEPGSWVTPEGNTNTALPVAPRLPGEQSPGSCNEELRREKGPP